MPKTYKKFIGWASTKAAKLFLVDGIGALISAFFLGVVLVRFQEIVGIPTSTLYFLAIFPCIFFLYDLFSFLFVNKKIPEFLHGIAEANLMYCGLSLAIGIYHRATITAWGWSYLLVEVGIIVLLASLQIHIARHFGGSTQ